MRRSASEHDTDWRDVLIDGVFASEDDMQPEAELLPAHHSAGREFSIRNLIRICR